MPVPEPNLDNIADNFFHCRETPLWFPDSISLNSLRICQSCIVRVSAPKVGATQRLIPIPRGFQFEEYSITSLLFNGLRYSLFDSYLLIRGAHRLPGKSAPEVAELCFYFKGDFNASQIRCVCLPVQIGNGLGNNYFSELGQNAISSRKTTLESLFNTSSQMYMYLGSDFIHTNTTTCLDSYKVTYMVGTTPVYILQSDFTRLMNLNTIPSAQRKTVSPLGGAPTATRIQNLVIVVPVIKLGEKDKPASSQNGNTRVQIPDTVALHQMKCRPLDKDKDIKNGTIYIGGEKRDGDSTLDDELQKAANLSKAWEESGSSIQPGDIENTIGGIMGVGIALFLVALISWGVLSVVFRKYTENVKNLYDKTKNPIVGMLLSTSSIIQKTSGSIHNFFCGIL